MANIAIIGAAGFVGAELVKYLELLGHTVTAIARDNAKFLLSKYKCTIINPKDVKYTEEFDSVINLAYPNSGSVHHYSLRNKEILSMIKKLSGQKAKVIHTSTLAVFGFNLDKLIEAKQIPNRSDYLYVESKIELENLLLKTFSADQLQIVRLGNIWGKGSASWTVPIIDKLLFGKPVGVIGMDGFSNVTDIQNVVSYLSFLALNKTSEQRIFHHLAEFSHVKWDVWINKIAETIHCVPVKTDSLPNYPMNAWSDIEVSFKPMNLKLLYKSLMIGRFAGSYLRKIISNIPESRFQVIKQQNITPMALVSQIDEADKTFLIVISAQTEFKPILDPQWKQEISVEDSWNNIYLWMKDVGYIE